MTTRLEGRITNVSDDDLGSTLDGDHAAGATTLKVQNAADFDEDGGSLVLNDQVIDYTSCDDDTDTITLAEGLAAAADDGDTVSVWDTLREAIAVDKTAEVDVGDDYSDDIEAVVALHLVQHLVEGPRGDDGESVILELDEEDDEWKVIDILGLGDPASSGIKFEADDYYALTAADVAAGVATIPLSHRPIDESVLAHWLSVAQRPTEYTVNYDDQTITWPLGGFEQAGDQFWFHYAYLKGVKTPKTSVVTIQMVSNSHKDTLALTFVMPDGSRYPVPGVNTPGAGPVEEFGEFIIENMNMEFSNLTTGVTVNYPAPAYIRRGRISGVDSRGAYEGYRYEFEDRGTAGDGDFNDIVMDVKGY